MLILKKENTTINEDNIVGNYYIIEEEKTYVIYEYIGSNDTYILLKFIERSLKSSMYLR